MVNCLSERSEYIGDGLWRWSVFLPPDAPFRDIQEVIYTLHPTFNRPVRKVLSQENGFLVQDITSCPFTVYARLVFTDGVEQLLEKHLDLTPRSPSSGSPSSRPRKPIIITVDDDAEVLRAVERDLRSRYRASYDVMRFDSAGIALEHLRHARDAGIEVAIIIADLRMPGLDGVEFLIEAAHLHPRAKRALLTAFTDADRAIAAINAGINGYILKPWDTPERGLYPTIDDLLHQWWSMRSDVSISESLRTRIL
jgi:CheY-like chemotaxis protein